jgi:hypothetical protein
VLQSVPCHGKNWVFVLILAINNNNIITRAITNQKVKEEKTLQGNSEEKFIVYIADE